VTEFVAIGPNCARVDEVAVPPSTGLCQDAGMEIRTLIEHLAAEGPLLAAAADRAGPDAPVPSCPGWLVRDLVRHTGGVHQWATSIVATPRVDAWDVDLDEVVGTWPPDDGLVDWYRASHAALVDALRQADPAVECYTFLVAPSPLAMWARRQAHETTIHRVDAELAAGRTVTPCSPDFAADGIDELLACFITRGAKRLRLDPPRSLLVQATDTDDQWAMRFGSGAVETVRNGPKRAADATIEGPAGELYLALWSRRDLATVDATGDPAALAHVAENVHIRWS
jgi:uncharacterized protein (TIGR03083 family)